MAVWKATWLGHAGFRLEIGDRRLLIDPWLRGNPSFDEARFDEAVDGVSHVIVTHGHFDHASSAPEIAQKTGAAVVGMVELAAWLGAQGVAETVGFNKGGTIDLGGVSATLVHAVHSSSAGSADAPVYLGGECGVILEADGDALYFMGDTDVFSDMALYQELHRPKFGIVPIGGHFTMDSRRAAFACTKFFSFDAVIPCHYQTFPLLEQSADAFASAVAPTRVLAPSVMETVTL